MDKRIYSSGQTFRQALEDVIRDRSRQRGVPQDRLRRQIAFDRFLARVFIESQSPWLLKGGYALEFRLKEIARSTTDIDLSVPSLQGTTPQKIREMLAEYKAGAPAANSKGKAKAAAVKSKPAQASAGKKKSRAKATAPV